MQGLLEKQPLVPGDGGALPRERVGVVALRAEEDEARQRDTGGRGAEGLRGTEADPEDWTRNKKKAAKKNENKKEPMNEAMAMIEMGNKHNSLCHNGGFT